LPFFLFSPYCFCFLLAPHPFFFLIIFKNILVTLVSSKIIMQHGGRFITTRLVTKMKKNLGISQVRFF
jgi:hypothetical protein